jgi:two-component system LytT family sensor kinase
MRLPLGEPGRKFGEGAGMLACRGQIAFAESSDRGERVGDWIVSVGVFGRTAGAGWNRLPLFWQAQIVGWSLFAIVDVVNLRVMFHDLSIAVARTAAIVTCLLLISVGMRRIYAARRVDELLTPRTIGLVALLSAGGAAAVAALIAGVSDRIGWKLPGRDGFDQFLFPFTHYTIVLIGWSLCYFWVRAEGAEQAEHKRALHAETEALRAELEKLRLQLEPHFLFNALNGVAEEIPDHPTAALAMLRDLTAYLRHSLAGIHQTVVTVDAEVAGTAAYLRVQKARFGDRLRVTLTVDPAAKSRRIASFLLQPLVENAVKHGRRETGLDLAIDIRAESNGLRIEIENTGSLRGSTSPPMRRPGIGLDNVRRRLALHYPGRHQFGLTERTNAPNRVAVRMVLEGEPCSAP